MSFVLSDSISPKILGLIDEVRPFFNKQIIGVSMSDFPIPENYKTPNSLAHLQNLSISTLNNLSDINIVIKREKHQYIYDIDGNKYCDFYMSNGAVIYGHNYGTLTKFTKNALSLGVSSTFVNKFYHRLMRQFQELTKKDVFFRLYNSSNVALIHLIAHLQPKTIAVNSEYLLDLFRQIVPLTDVEITQANKSYDLAVYEPIDFDGDLSEVDFASANAKTTVSFETRTAFRLQYGFIKNLGDVDIIFSGANIVNGLDVAVMLSQKATLTNILPTTIENIPSYKTLAINETLKFYRRKIDYANFGMEIKSPMVEAQNKSIFKLKKDVSTADLLSRGVFMMGKVGFISYLHTEHDVKRLLACFK